MRQHSAVSAMPEPSSPGSPFMASFQPGLFASISMPMPDGSSSANLVTQSRKSFATGDTA